MIKFKQGSIGDGKGEWRDVIVKAKAPNTLRDALIGGSMVMVGIAYLTYTAFRHGSDALEMAETNTFEALKLLEPYESDGEILK